MATHVYHWKHGWVPLDHEAALSKSKGNKKAAAAMLHDAHTSGGIKTRRDVAKATLGLPSIQNHGDRMAAKHETIKAAEHLGATDMLPHSMQRQAPARVSIRPGSYRGESGHNITGKDSRGRSVSVFTPGDRKAAESTAANIKAGRPAFAKPLSDSTLKDLRGGSADAHLVTDASGTHFTAERQALHDKIVSDIVTGHAKQDKPGFVMLGGGPASGKTKAAEAAAKDFPDAITINPDDLKLALPEYAKTHPDQAAGFTHEESSYLAKKVTEAALASHSNVVLDAVGNNSATKVKAKIDQARAAGYSVHGRYVTVPTGVAQERARLRGIRSGRVVNPATISELHSGVSRVFPEVLQHFDTATLHDNGGKTFTHVLSATHGSAPVIHSPNLYQQFIGKGNG